MEVSVAVKDGLERQITVQVPESDLASAMDSRFSDIARSARINGFRPGKVPMSVVKKRFGDQVRQEVVGDLLRSSFSEAVQKEDLKPAGAPTIDPLDVTPGAGMSYTATFEVMPEVEVAPLDKVKIVRPLTEITDAEVDEMVESLRKQHITYETVERAAQNEDRITIDFTGTIEGEAFEGGSGEGVKLTLGMDQFIPGFEEGMVGLSAGDNKTLDLAFPDDYRNADLAGKPVSFDVTVTAVEEPKLPELDAEFFTKYQQPDATVETFRTDVRENMERERDAAQKSLLKKRVMDALVAANDIALPSALVHNEQERMLEEMKQMLVGQGAKREDLAPLKSDAFADRAANRVALSFIVQELSVQAKLEADPEAVKAEIEKVAATYEDADEVVKWYYEKPERLQEVEALVAENALVDWICENAQVEDESLGFQALMEQNRAAAQSR